MGISTSIENTQKLSLEKSTKPFRALEGKELDLFIKRFNRRIYKFIDEGLSVDESYELADKLFDRDLFPEQDDRHVCFECKNYDDEKKLCNAILDKNGRPTQQMRFALMRCPQFEIKVKK